MNVKKEMRIQMKNNSRHDDGRRNMPKRMCPVCRYRTIDFPEKWVYHQCNLSEYRISTMNQQKCDMVIQCPNPKCGAILAVSIKALHTRYGLVNVPIIGTVIS